MAERFKKTSTPEEFIKVFFEKKDVELKWKIKRKIINWATIIEFEKREDFINYTWYKNSVWRWTTRTDT